MPQPTDVERLQSNIEWAVANGLGPRDLVPMLTRLLEQAADGSAVQLAARQQLAELVVEKDPWRASLLLRNVLSQREDAVDWALYGLAQILLENYRSARKAYARALALSPRCPSYAHNLGHLIDAVFQQPHQALPYLRQAYVSAPNEPEIAASYAHALNATGQRRAAVDIMEPLVESRARAWEWIRRWTAEQRELRQVDRPPRRGEHSSS